MRCCVGVTLALATVLHPMSYTWRLHSGQRYKLRQRAHPLAYSVTYETKAQVRVAHHLIGVVAAKHFQEPWTMARQIADRSTSIISGTTLSHPNSVVYPCMIYFRLSPHNSPIWRKHIHNFKTFEKFLHVFVTRMTHCVWK
jgi:hypothetical protein